MKMKMLVFAILAAMCSFAEPVVIGGSGGMAADHRLESRRHEGIPSIAVDPVTGRLWTTWYGGVTPNEDNNNYLILSTSCDGGKTWKEVMYYDPDGAGPVRAFDCELWVSPDGKLRWTWTERKVVLRGEALPDGRPSDAGWWAGHSDRDAIRGDRLMMMTLDAGKEPSVRDLVPREIGRGVMMCKPIVAKNGDWIFPVSRWFEEKSAGLLVSSDGGRTFAWTGAASIPECIRTFDEHCVVEMPDGRLRIWMRTNNGEMTSDSLDWGKTWTVAVSANFKAPPTRHVVRRLVSGNLLLVAHGATDENPGRSKLTAFLSRDDGETWQGGLLLDVRRRSSYPDVDQDPDGTIYAVWDNDRCVKREVLFARFVEDDVLAGRPISQGCSIGVKVSAAPLGSVKFFMPLPDCSIKYLGGTNETLLCAGRASGDEARSIAELVDELIVSGSVGVADMMEGIAYGNPPSGIVSGDALTALVRTMWMSTPDGGLAAVAFAPSRVVAQTNAGEVEFEMITDYPYGRKVTIRDVRGTGYFPLLVRIPSWCGRKDAGTFAEFAFNWKPGREVTLDFQNHQEKRQK